MKYYIIAGEKSGDLHASNLVKAIKSLDKDALFRGFGGERMEEQGVEIVVHYQKMAFMGFLEVIKNLPTISKYLRQCKNDINTWQPDAVILVDYAGFNLRIAKFAHKEKVKTFYYISPKVWAWNTRRAKTIKKVVDKMFVILPFEKAFYEKYNYPVEYVGNPLFDEIAQFHPDPTFSTRHFFQNKPIVVVLPGSRAQEVSNMLETMLAIAPQFKEYQWCVAGVSTLPKMLYEPARQLNIPIIYDETYDLLTHAKYAIVTSGTATLETALFGVPQIVCYKTSIISYAIAKRLIAVPYISLVNLIADKPIIEELIQNDFNPERLTRAFKHMLESEEEIEKEYVALKKKIATEDASQQTAKLMWEALNSSEN